MSHFSNLENENYMSLTTTRKSGIAVPTPVWFAEKDGKLYVYTSPDSGKVKRIRHTTAVTVAPCTSNGTVTGESVAGIARILSDAEGKMADQILNQKYGWQKRLFTLYVRIRNLGDRRLPAYLEISPPE